MTISSFFQRDLTYCIKYSEKTTLDVIESLFLNQDCGTEGLKSCGFFCIESDGTCPILYFGISSDGDAESQMIRNITSPNSDGVFIHKNLKFFTGLDTKGDKREEFINFYFVRSSAFDTDYIREHDEFKYIFDLLPVTHFKIAENSICKNDINSRTDANNFPLSPKKHCPENPSYSKIEIEGVSGDNYLTTGSILAYNNGPKYIFSIDGFFSNSLNAEWYLFQGSAFSNDLFRCIISWENGLRYSKSSKISLLDSRISFFTSLTSNYNFITVLIDITFWFTVLVSVLLFIFAFSLIFGKILCGIRDLPCIPGEGGSEFEFLEHVIEWIEFLAEIIMLILSIISYAVLYSTSNNVDSAINTDCFQGYALAELTSFGKILNDFLDSGLQSILIFGFRLLLFSGISLLKVTGFFIIRRKTRKACEAQS